MIKCIIISHGDLGRSLLYTTEKIIGPSDGIAVLSNELTSLKDLIANLDSLVNDWREHDILIMVDFCGGSCWHAAQVVQHDRTNVVLLSGVNLTMMLAFVSRRDSYKLPELAEYLKESSFKGTEIIIRSKKQESD